jgi:hypothetical protein
MRARFASWLGLFFACVACKHPPQRSEPGAAAAKTSSTYPAPQNSGAFELTSAESGAALIVADAARGGLSLTLFDSACKASGCTIRRLMARREAYL